MKYWKEYDLHIIVSTLLIAFAGIIVLCIIVAEAKEDFMISIDEMSYNIWNLLKLTPSTI